MRKDLLDKQDLLFQMVQEKQSYAYMAKKLNCARDTLISLLKKLGIEYRGNQGRKGLKYSGVKKSSDQLIEHAKKTGNISFWRLRNKLIEEGKRECKCELCGITEWMGKPITLEVHHKDFNHHNNELCNLMLICSNCHTYIHHYRGL